MCPPRHRPRRLRPQRRQICVPQERPYKLRPPRNVFLDNTWIGHLRQITDVICSAPLGMSKYRYRGSCGASKDISAHFLRFTTFLHVVWNLVGFGAIFKCFTRLEPFLGVLRRFCWFFEDFIGFRTFSVFFVCFVRFVPFLGVLRRFCSFFEDFIGFRTFSVFFVGFGRFFCKKMEKCANFVVFDNFLYFAFRNAPGTLPERSRNAPGTPPERPRNAPGTPPEHPRNAPAGQTHKIKKKNRKI